MVIKHDIKTADISQSLMQPVHISDSGKEDPQPRHNLGSRTDLNLRVFTAPKTIKTRTESELPNGHSEKIRNNLDRTLSRVPTSDHKPIDRPRVKSTRAIASLQAAGDSRPQPATLSRVNRHLLAFVFCVSCTVSLLTALFFSSL